MSDLGLPPGVRTGLARLADLPDESFQDLRAAIISAPPGITRYRFASKVASSLPGIPSEDVERIIASVMHLLSFRVQDADLSGFVEDVVRDMQQTGTRTKIGADKADALKSRLIDILRIDSLQLRSKATDLMLEHAHVFQGARIITDIRPVFGGGKPLGIQGSLVTHSMKIEFFGASGSEEIYISMGDDDIAEMKRVLDRAEQKASAIRSLLQNCQIMDLNPQDLKDNA